MRRLWGLRVLLRQVHYLQPDSSSSALYSGIGSALVPNGAVFGEKVFIKIEALGNAIVPANVELNTVYECTSTSRSSSNLFQQAQLIRDSDNREGWVSSGNANNLRIRVYHTRPSGITLPSARPEFLAVDIIGATTAMPQEWLDNGIPGNWLAVGEEGEDLIPDGTPKNFKLSRKCLECYLVLQTLDNGVSWNVDTVNWQSLFESPENARSASPSDIGIYMVFYRTAANPFELADNERYKILSENAYATSWSVHNGGCLIASNFIDKVPTGTGAPLFETVDLLTVGRDSRQPVLAPSTTFGITEHRPLSEHGHTETPRVKFIGYLSDSFLHTVYKELKHNGTSWGDDEQFNIVDNQSTVPDNNSQQVIVGQKRVALPYHFDGDLY